MYVYPNLEAVFSMPYSMVLFVLSDISEGIIARFVDIDEHFYHQSLDCLAA